VQVRHKLLSTIDIGSSLKRLERASENLELVLKAVSYAQQEYEKARQKTREAKQNLEEAEIIAITEVWPEIDSKDPVTGRSNKGWAETLLKQKISQHEQVASAREALRQAEGDELAWLNNLNDKKARMKTAELSFRVAELEVQARIAQLNFLAGGNENGSES